MNLTNCAPEEKTVRSWNTGPVRRLEHSTSGRESDERRLDLSSKPCTAYYCTDDYDDYFKDYKTSYYTHTVIFSRLHALHKMQNATKLWLDEPDCTCKRISECRLDLNGIKSVRKPDTTINWSAKSIPVTQWLNWQPKCDSTPSISLLKALTKNWIAEQTSVSWIIDHAKENRSRRNIFTSNTKKSLKLSSRWNIDQAVQDFNFKKNFYRNEHKW